MVIHEREQQERWTERQISERQRRPKREREPRRVSVLAVQCLVCVTAVLLALVFRMAGGEAYVQLQQSFVSALNGNEWMAAVMRLWDDEPSESDIFASKEGVKDENFTSDEVAETM